MNLSKYQISGLMPASIICGAALYCDSSDFTDKTIKTKTTKTTKV